MTPTAQPHSLGSSRLLRCVDDRACLSRRGREWLQSLSQSGSGGRWRSLRTTISGGLADRLYCIFGCGTIFKLAPDGTLTAIYAFCHDPYCMDGIDSSALIQGMNGDFYGTTSTAGNGFGTVFTVTPSGTLTLLHAFCSGACTDGAGPDGGLVQAANGDLSARKPPARTAVTQLGR
jgi:uncharacterized repeat protein (TIGR03803 family)